MDLEDYITNSNECFEINLTRPLKNAPSPEPIFSESFNPTFTYAIFNEKESIIGYKEPSIQLDFRANDMKPSLKVGFEEKLEIPEGMLPEEDKVDLVTVFNGFLPASVMNPAEAPDDAAPTPDPTSRDWTPPGKQLHKVVHHGKQFEVWVANLSDPAAKKIWENMQILTLLYIEGASLPELDADWSLERWSLYFLYEITPIEEDGSPYTLAGFSTTYRYWVFPSFDIMRATKSLPSPPASTNGDAGWSPPRLTQDSKTFLFNEHIDPLEQPSRERISQFLILPPYQGQSLGATLYSTIFADLSKKPYIFEIPVEDPSEAFDAMRDFSDIVYLRTLPTFKSLTIPTNLPNDKLAKNAPIPRDEILGNGADLAQLRRDTKIVTRQFNRMLELHLLSTIPSANRKKARITRKAKSTNENDRRYYFWRLALKDRIYRQNRDALEQLEDAVERVDRIEMAVDAQQGEYEERLQGLEKRAKWSNGEAQDGSGSRPKRKRAVVDDDEEDDWEDIDEESVASSKKMKV
ncbi:histone acetyltransferase 1 [Kalmusia sp. IMI 367209]|nr:histone acetyltransferase 1 [Kalmusia sp. IMI 367209]